MTVHPDQAGRQIALVVRNQIHRYGIEGMIRAATGAATHTVRRLGFGGEDVRGYRGERLDLVLAAAADLDLEPLREAVRALCADGPGLLLLVDGPDACDAPWLASCGARGFLDSTDLEPWTLADAMADVLAGKFFVSAALAQRFLTGGRTAAPGAPQRGPAVPALTPRELEVLRLLADGLSNKQVSRRLLISEHGVKRLVGNVLAKLNCPNRTLAVVRAMDDGLLAV